MLVALFTVLLIAAGCAPDHRDIATDTAFELARTHGRYVDVNGLDTFVIVDGQGPELLLIHGNPSSNYTWRHLIEPLSRSYRVHAIDLPGYGMSEKPADAPFNSTWFAGHALAYLKIAGVKRAVAIGSSMGGEVASEMAALYPATVRGMVLIAPGGLPAREPQKRPFALRIARWPLAGRLAAWLPLRSVFAATLRESYFDPALVSDADIDAYYAPTRSRNGLDAFFATINDDGELDRSRIVRTIKAPTLILVGEVDRLVPLSVARRYHHLVAGSRFEVITKAGHLPQEEQPGATLAVLESWLARLP